MQSKLLDKLNKQIREDKYQRIIAIPEAKRSIMDRMWLRIYYENEDKNEAETRRGNTKGRL